jgi:hypothetical protein
LGTSPFGVIVGCWEISRIGTRMSGLEPWTYVLRLPGNGGTADAEMKGKDEVDMKKTSLSRLHVA